MNFRLFRFETVGERVILLSEHASLLVSGLACPILAPASSYIHSRLRPAQN